MLSSFARAALVEAEIYESQLGSDHCPVSVTLDLGRLHTAAEAAAEKSSAKVAAETPGTKVVPAAEAPGPKVAPAPEAARG